MDTETTKKLKNPNNFISRELSWLRFNTRVLDEAKSTRHPLLERLKFIAIYGTNLDEFYMVRVAGLQEMYKMGINAVGADKMTDEQSVKLSDEIATKIQNEMTYPGQVKITVIRETRSVAYAK